MKGGNQWNRYIVMFKAISNALTSLLIFQYIHANVPAHILVLHQQSKAVTLQKQWKRKELMETKKPL